LQNENNIPQHQSKENNKEFKDDFDNKENIENFTDNSNQVSKLETLKKRLNIKVIPKMVGMTK